MSSLTPTILMSRPFTPPTPVLQPKAALSETISGPLTPTILMSRPFTPPTPVFQSQAALTQVSETISRPLTLAMEAVKSSASASPPPIYFPLEEET